MQLKCIALTAIVTLSSVSSFSQAETPPAFQQVEALMQCFEKKEKSEECKIKLADRFHTPFARLLRGYALFYTDKPKAMEDFQWAADQGYPPAYTAMFIATKDNPRAHYKWIKKAAENGMGGTAQYYLRHIDSEVARTLQLAEDFTLFTMVQCHPAHLRDTNEIYLMFEFMNKHQIKDLNEGVSKYWESQKAYLDDRKQAFLQGCSQSTYAFRYDTPEEQLNAGMKQARQRMAQTLANIKAAVKKFPELQILTRTEYLDVAPAP